MVKNSIKKDNIGNHAKRNGINLLGKFLSSTLISHSLLTMPVNAFGPTELKINIIDYKIVELCDGRKPIM